MTILYLFFDYHSDRLHDMATAEHIKRKQSSVSGVILSPPPPFFLLLDSTLAYLTLSLKQNSKPTTVKANHFYSYIKKQVYIYV